MLAEILFALLVLAVAVLMAADVARTRSEGLQGQAYDAERAFTEAPRGIAALRSTGATPFTPEPAGSETGVPAPDVALPRRPDAGLSRRVEAIGTGRPEAIGSSANDQRHPGTWSAVQDKDARRGLRSWHVRTRLFLLVLIPTVTVTAVALGVARIVGTLQGAPSNSASDKAMLSALSVGVVVIIVVASWFTIAVARSVLQPLRRLQAGAREAAAVRLPDAIQRIGQGNGRGMPSDLAPIDVDSSDEIGEVGRAFDQMRREMMRLAVNEAAFRGRLDAMFVNLSHRSQSLVERQMRLLDHLEQGEQDAERLASLVSMNRLASRMHRNAQNLLVLVGHESSSGWNQPVALVNLIRTAVSEIEGYERVAVNAQPDIAVRGPAVNDVVHLLAELIENATSFSAPDMPVDISGHLLTSGVLVDITDRGIGMAAKEMAYANWQLENPPTADISVPKWVGLLVVARLAARHAIRVRLQSAELGGLTALVWLPDELITGQGAAASPRLGGFRGAGPAPGLHERPMDSGHTTAEQRATPRSTELTSPQEDMQGASLGRQLIFEPGGSEPSQFVSALPGTAASLSQEISSADGSEIVPPAEGPAETPGLPIYDEVESFWFSSGRKARGSSDLAEADGSRWSSPADQGWRAAETVDSPSSSGSTAAGLPKRLPNANLAPGVIPGTQPVAPTRSAAAVRDRLAGFQQGVSQARAASSQAAKAAGEGES